MRKELKEYIEKVEQLIKKDQIGKNTLNEIKTKIEFFQHERLIHLIVTSLFAILSIITTVGVLITKNIALSILLIVFILLLIPYIYHYYYLENKVQYLYKLYDQIEKNDLT